MQIKQCIYFNHKQTWKEKVKSSKILDEKMLVMLFPDFFQSLEYQSNLAWYQPRGKQSNRNEDTQNPQFKSSPQTFKSCQNVWNYWCQNRILKWQTDQNRCRLYVAFSFVNGNVRYNYINSVLRVAEVDSLSANEKMATKFSSGAYLLF